MNSNVIQHHSSLRSQHDGCGSSHHHDCFKNQSMSILSMSINSFLYFRFLCGIALVHGIFVKIVESTSDFQRIFALEIISEQDSVQKPAKPTNFKCFLRDGSRHFEFQRIWSSIHFIASLYHTIVKAMCATHHTWYIMKV